METLKERKNREKAYEQKQLFIRDLIYDITDRIEMHEIMADSRGWPWNLIGDLGHVEESLKEINRFLGG